MAEEMMLDVAGMIPGLKPVVKKTLENDRVQSLTRYDVGKMFHRMLAGFRWIKDRESHG